MAKVEVKQDVCEKCGVEVRENTQFCYNCGGRVTGEMEIKPSSNGTGSEVDAETQAALDDLAERLKIEEVTDEDGKLAKAAAERRKARVAPKMTKEFIWEPVEESSSRIVLLLALLIAVIATAIVFVTVFWK